MGAKHSKPRIRRSGRFRSTGKRQAPEGSNDPVLVVNESCNRDISNSQKAYTTTQHSEKSCNFCKTPEKCHNLFTDTNDHSKIGGVVTSSRQGDFHRSLSPEKASFLDDFLKQNDLKVELPRSPSCCRNCKTDEKSKSLPQKTTFNDSSKLSDKEDDEEWTITLYEIDNKVQGRAPREDMVRLMSSIYDAVDNKMGEAPHGRKTVKVQLSVTPERRSQSKVHRTSSAINREQSECRCPDCPKTEPPNRRTTIIDEPRIRRYKSDVSPSQGIQAKQIADSPINNQKTQNPWQQRPIREQSTENKERRRHYAKLEGVDSTNQQRFTNKETDFAKNIGRSKDSRINKSRTLPNYEERHQEKLEKGACSKRRLRLHDNSDHRNAMLRMRRKDPRFASPYDQHFQEAMYLRLRELQRQGANEVCRATGKPQDSDEADDDSDIEPQFEKQISNKNIQNTVSNNDCDDDKLTNCNNASDLQYNNSPDDDLENNIIHRDAVSVHHHHHYHHGIPEGSFLSALCPDSPSTNQTPDHSSSVVSTEGDDATTHHHYHHHYHHAEKS